MREAENRLLNRELQLRGQGWTEGQECVWRCEPRVRDAGGELEHMNLTPALFGPGWSMTLSAPSSMANKKVSPGALKPHSKVLVASVGLIPYF